MKRKKKYETSVFTYKGLSFVNGLTRPAPSVVVATILILDIQVSRADFLIEFVVAIYLDVRVHNGYQLERKIYVIINKWYLTKFT